MKDELLQYLKRKIKEKFITSFRGRDLLLWGIQTCPTTLTILGLTLNIGVKTSDIQLFSVNDLMGDKDSLYMYHGALNLAKASESKFLIILYTSDILADGALRLLEPKKNDIRNFSIDITEKAHEFASTLQKTFGTQLQPSGTAKKVNVRVADVFHVWARNNLPREYVRTDIDGLVIGNDHMPKKIIEIKRSYMDVHKWSPWRADLRNYQLQLLLAKKANIDFFTLYHQKNININEDTYIGKFKIRDVSPEKLGDWIAYDFTIQSAQNIDIE